MRSAGLSPEHLYRNSRATEKPDSLYFGGHRPIQGNYSLRQNGKYVQIHNPDRQNIVLVYKDRPIDLDANIVQVDKAII